MVNLKFPDFIVGMKPLFTSSIALFMGIEPAFGSVPDHFIFFNLTNLETLEAYFDWKRASFPNAQSVFLWAQSQAQ